MSCASLFAILSPVGPGRCREPHVSELRVSEAGDPDTLHGHRGYPNEVL